RQRVAIGRALLARPRLLLFDEPLASLDQARRREILPYVSALHAELGTPFVYVSHAVEEVARLAQHVVVLGQGRVVASGSPADVLGAGSGAGPRRGFDAVSVLEALVRAHDVPYQLTVLDHPSGNISVPGIVGAVGDLHRVLVRATDVALALQRPREVSYRTILRATIVDIEQDEGPVARVGMTLRGGGRIVALVTRKSIDELGVDVGDDAFAIVKSISLDERALALDRGAQSPKPASQD
ncbi:MAG TPA: TOBE domain-containing protein, partial [Quisquiliibacterium sp.]|nr:TOBE domain-containing protein [Quisquiliibacterium sp.]